MAYTIYEAPALECVPCTSARARRRRAPALTRVSFLPSRRCQLAVLLLDALRLILSAGALRSPQTVSLLSPPSLHREETSFGPYGETHLKTLRSSATTADLRRGLR